MKIAFISTIRGYPWGGADALWTKAAEAAVQRGDSIFIATTDAVLAHARIAALLTAGAQSFERPRIDIPLGRMARGVNVVRRVVRMADPLIRALEKFAPELVIFSCGGTYDLVGETVAVDWLKTRGIPFRAIANWQREFPALDQLDRERAHAPLAAATQVFFLSRRNLEATRRHLCAPLERASVIQIPLRDDIRDQQPWPATNDFGFAAVGRLEPVKGFDLLLHALHAAIGRESNWRVTFFGRGVESTALERTAQALGLSGRTRFAGHVATASKIWSDNHLFVSPALDEGVPMTIPEAMFAGRPVLATRVGGAEEWIREGETGYLCAAPSFELLAATIERAWQQRATWKQLGDNARLSAVAHYDQQDYLRVIS